jgi:cyclin G2
MWLTQMLEGLNCCLKNEQALACPPATLYAINPVSSDKVDGTMRDDAIFNLLFLHKAFFSLSPATFCRAVHIVDQFIVRVKVKPKYMACVAAASYLIAAEFHEKPEDRPTAEELVNLTQCGGTVDDMDRMTTIIHSKLNRFVSGSTPMDYVKVFVRLINFIMKASREKNVPNEDPMLFSMSGEAQQRANNRILISLTSLQSREFSSACFALASLWLEWNGSKVDSASNSSHLDALAHNVFQKLANLCQIPWDVLQQCASSVYKIYHICYNQALPCSREHLFWCLSRRTRNNLDNMSIRRCSGATRLQSISEEEEVATA